MDLTLIEDTFNKLVGSTVFCVLDLLDAYLQLQLSDDSKQYLIINILLGLFQYQGLCFGLACALVIFQSVMDQTVRGIPNVCCCLDIIFCDKDFAKCKKTHFIVL